MRFARFEWIFDERGERFSRIPLLFFFVFFGDGRKKRK